MGRYGITYELVAEAADKLAAAEIIPTIEQIRRELGDTGSFSNIAKHLRVWKSRHFIPKVKLASTVPDPIQRAVSDVWSKIYLESQSEIENFKNSLEETQKREMEEKEALLAKVAELEPEIERMELQINHLETDLKLSQRELIQERKEKAILEERLKQQELGFTNLKNEMDQRLKDALNNYEISSFSLKEQLQRKEKDIAEYRELLEKQRQESILQIDQTRIAKEKTEASLIKAQMDAKQKVQILQMREEELRALAVDFKVLQQEHLELNNKNRDLEKLNVSLQSELKLKDELLQMRDTVTQELQITNSDLKVELAHLKNRDKEKVA